MLRRNFRILNLPKFDLVPIPRSYKEPQSKWKYLFQKYLWTCCRVSAQEHGVLWRRDAQGVHGLVRYFFLRLEINDNTSVPCLNIYFTFNIRVRQLHPQELCTALQVNIIISLTTSSLTPLLRNGRLELLAMHHAPLMRAMEKMRGHGRP